MKASRPHWIKDKLLNIIVQMGLAKLAELPEVPSALDLVNDPERRQVLELILIRQEAGRPFAAPPGVPAERSPRCGAPSTPRLETWNSAPMRRRRNWRSSRSPRGEIENLLAKAYGTPRAIVQKAAALVEPSGRAQ